MENGRVCKKNDGAPQTTAKGPSTPCSLLSSPRTTCTLLLGGGASTTTPVSTTTTASEVALTSTPVRPLTSMAVRRGRTTSSRPSRRPLASLLLGLDIDPDPAGITTCVDPDTTITTLGLVEGCNDGSFSGLDGVKFEESTCFVTHDFKLFDRPEALSEGLRELILGDWLSYALREQRRGLLYIR